MSTHTIKLYGDIGKWDPVNATVLEKMLSEAPQGYDTLRAHVHSDGGEVYEGWAMYNTFLQLRQSGKKVVFHIDGIAASMMSFIILAGDSIEMAENSMLMIHAPSGYNRGTAADMKEASERLEKVENLMIEGYMSATGKPRETIEEWMSKDTWMTPQEALSAGLISRITSPVLTSSMDVKALRRLEPKQAYATFIPQQDRSMKSIIAHLGLKESADEAQILAKIRTMESEQVKAEAKATDLENKLKAANDKVADLEKSQRTEKAKLLVAQAVDSGRIPKAQQEKYEKLAEMDYATTKEVIEAMTVYTPPSSQLKPDGNLTESEEHAKEYHKRHAEGTLAKLKTENPDHFEKIRKAALG